jgi:hypothetical protein
MAKKKSTKKSTPKSTKKSAPKKKASGAKKSVKKPAASGKRIAAKTRVKAKPVAKKAKARPTKRPSKKRAAGASPSRDRSVALGMAPASGVPVSAALDLETLVLNALIALGPGWHTPEQVQGAISDGYYSVTDVWVALHLLAVRGKAHESRDGRHYCASIYPRPEEN